MKTTNYILGTVLVSSLLLVCCKKDADTMSSGLNTTAAAFTTSDTANINLQLKAILPPSSDVLQWNGGYIATREISFSGIEICGNALKMISVSTLEPPRTIENLFAAPALGTLRVLAGKYENISMSVLLMNAPIPDLPDVNYSIVLNGTYKDYYDVSGTTSHADLRVTEGYSPVAVVVKIPLPVKLNCAPVTDFSFQATNYQAIISLDLARLTAGIDVSDLNHAVRSGKTILISNNSNVALYNIIISNLQNNLLPVQLIPAGSNIPYLSQAPVAQQQFH